MIARHELAVEHHLIDRAAIDRVLERAADARVGPERRLCFISVADVHGDPEVAELDRRAEPEIGIGAHIFDVGREHALDQIEAA